MKRNARLTNIRVLAILMVVFGHSIILYSTSWNLYFTENQVPFLEFLKQIIDIFQMPLFFAVSGYLFFYSLKKRSLLGLIKNKIQRLLIPYLSVAVFYLLPIRLLVRYPNYLNISFFTFFKKVITVTDVGHLWYLPVLFIIFLIAACVLKLSMKVFKSIKASTMLLFAVSWVLYLRGYKIGIMYPPLLIAFNYLIWFSFGYGLNTFSSAVEVLYKSFILKSISVAFTLALLVFSMYTSGTVILLRMATIFLFLISIFEIMPAKTNTALTYIDRNSFGLYLFHSPLIYIVFSTIPNASPLLIVFINFVICGFIAYLLTDFTRKLNLGFVIGE